MKKTRIQCVLACLSIILSCSAWSVEEQPEAEQPAKEVEQLTVYSNGNYQSLQPSHFEISHTLSAEEMASLPDLNIADSLKRVVGLQAINDTDEGQFITIRGIDADLNAITLDGMAMLSGDNFGGRRNNIETIPGAALSQVNIYKTQRANLDGNAIGANVDLRTGSALSGNSEKKYEFMLARYSFDDVPDDSGDKLSGRASVNWIEQFGPSRQFGLLFSGYYLSKNRDESKISNDKYQYQDVVLENGDICACPVNSNLRTLQYSNNWQRYSALVKFEYRPRPDLYAYFKTFTFQQNENEQRYFTYLDNRSKVPSIPDTGKKGNIDQAKITQRYSARPTRRENSGMHFSFSSEFNPNNSLSLDLAYSSGVYDRPYQDLRFVSETSNEFAYSYDMSHRYTMAAFNKPQLINNPEQYGFDSLSLRNERQDESIKQFKLDWLNEGIDSNEESTAFRLGIDLRHSDRDFNYQENNYGLQPGAKNYRLDDFYLSNTYQPKHFNFPIIMVDGKHFLSQFNQGLLDLEYDEKDSLTSSNNDDYTFEEKTYSAFIQYDKAYTNWKWNAGLRYENTRGLSRALSFNRDTQQYQDNETQARNDFFIPSLNIYKSIDKRTSLKIGLGRSIGRANPIDLTAKQYAYFDDSREKLIIDRSNPDLEPRVSNNIDLALNYKPSGFSGYFSLGIFQKSIKNLIFSAESDGGSIDGVEVLYLEDENAESAEIKGLEFDFLVSRLPFLPSSIQDIGLRANLTLIAAQMSYYQKSCRHKPESCPKVELDKILEQAELLGNLVLFYEGDNLEFSIAHHYSGDYLDGINTNLSAKERERSARYWQGYGQTDLQISWSIFSSSLLKFQIRNLSNQKRTRMTGKSQSLFSEDITFGRSVWLGYEHTFH